MYKIV